MRKIKRYNRIYTKRKGSKLLRVLGFLVVCGVLIFVGFSLYGPIQDLIEGLKNPVSSSSDTSSLPDSSSASVDSSSVPSSSSEPEDSTAIKGAYLPASVLSDDFAFGRFLTFVKEQNINTIVLEMKSSDGVVHYNSALENVISAGAVDEAADIGERLDELKENGLAAIALVHVFEDRLAARIFYESAVKYMNTGTNWLDNSLDQGGKPWLNPYADFSTTYNLDIASELLDLGFSGVMADSVQFPSGYALSYATYGENQSSETRQQCLSDFVSRLNELAQSKGKTAMLAASVTASLSPDEQINGTDGPLLYGSGMVSPYLILASFGTQLTAGGLSLENPAKTPAQTVTAVVSAMLQKNADTRYIPFIQCYTDSSLSSESNKTYTLEDVSAEIEALKGQGIEDYILYDPEGAYSIS